MGNCQGFALHSQLSRQKPKGFTQQNARIRSMFSNIKTTLLLGGERTAGGSGSGAGVR